MSDPAPVLVLLGGAGDLAMRMLLPSLYHLELDGLLPRGLRIIGVGRADGDADSYRAEVRADLVARDILEDDSWARMSARLDYCPADAAKPEGAMRLAGRTASRGEVVFF